MDAENTEETREPDRFELEGKTYEMPNLRELNIDEWMIMYRYSKVVLRDLMAIPDDPQAEQDRIDKLEQPGVMKALFHIAYKRAHPKKTDAAIDAIVGRIKYLPTLEAMDDGDDQEVSEEEDPTPATTEPESEPSEPEPSSLRSSDSSSGNGSSSSETSSETPEADLAATGTSG